MPAISGVFAVRDGLVFGKPADEAGALAMLCALAGKTHSVITAVALHEPPDEDCSVFSVETAVTFIENRHELYAAYARSGEGMDKAGAYAVQGRGAALVARIVGSLTNVIGLPLGETLERLSREATRT